MTESMAAVRRAWLVRACASALGLAVAYFLAAEVGELFTTRFGVSPLWPPAGVAVAALLVLGRQAWPGVALGAVAFEVGRYDAGAVALIVAGDILAPLATVWALRRFGFVGQFRRLRDAAAFVGAALGGTTLSAGLGTLALVASGPVSGRDAGATWWIWWAGDATGVLALTPVLLLLPHVPLLVRGTPRLRLLEWVADLVLTGAFAWLGLLSHGGMEFVALPAMVWTALRFGTAGAAPAALLVAVLAEVAAAIPVGEFGEGGTVSRMVHLQTFTGVSALTALLVAGLTTERWHERREAERRLEAAVAERTAELSDSLAQVQAGEALLAEAQRVGRVGSFEFDVASGVVLWSAEMSRLWGLPAERRAATYEEYVARLHPEDRDHVLGVVEAAMEERRPYEFVHRVQGEDGVVRWLQANGRFRTDGDRVILFGTAQDITEARAAAEALRQKNEEDLATRLESERALLDALEQQRAAAARLREVDRMRSDVVATVSHELRTPLSAITGFLELLLDDDDDESRRPMLSAAHRSATRLTELVEDLLSMARIEAAGPVNRRPGLVVDFAAVVHEAVASVRQIFEQRNQTLSVDMAEDESWPVVGDARQLDRVLINLLSNAAKYTPEGGCIGLRVAQAGDQVEVAVSDTGVGIPASEIGRLFDRFYRASTAGDRPGSGLGLSIVKTIVDRHGGRLSVESQPGVGSTFTLVLPLSQRIVAGVQ